MTVTNAELNILATGYVTKQSEDSKDDCSVRENNMNTSEILKEMNITFDDEKDNLFDFFLKHKKTKVLDIFPEIINDNEKYQSVEVFYQKVLDHCMKKQEFENIENRFFAFC